jgi:hypothetical protein
MMMETAFLRLSTISAKSLNPLLIQTMMLILMNNLQLEGIDDSDNLYTEFQYMESSNFGKSL